MRNKTLGIILRRTNYKEADKVVTLLTKDFGRIAVIAKGVRRPKSRMAGGIEPFTVSRVDFIKGKGNLSTLVSARVKSYFKNIVKEYERAALGGELLQTMNKLIEDDVGEEYFALAEELLKSLDNLKISADVIDVWFRLQLLTLLGRQPELLTDSEGEELKEERSYHFNPDDGSFLTSEQGSFTALQIKAWRVLTTSTPTISLKVKGLDEAVAPTVDALKMFMAENNF